MTGSPRRVLMTTDTVGGVWTYALELASGLAAAGTEVVLAAMGGAPSEGQRAAANAISGLELRVGDYRLEWMEDPWEDVRAAGAWLLTLARGFAPDVVHLNGYAHGALPWHAPVLMVAHSCVLSWWRAVKGEEAPPAWRRYAGEVAHGLRAASLVVAPTAAMLDSVQRDYGPLVRTAVIANGRDPARFSTSRKLPAVISCGRLWDEAKNVGALVRVAPSLPWPVRVAGETRHPEGGAARLDGVTCLGRLDEAALARELASASIFVLPARYEPFGLSPLEAALSGCALVLGDLPSLREVWGDAAEFVPPDDEVALGAAITRLCSDPQRLRTMAARAGARALRYSPQAMAGAYLAAYRQLIAVAAPQRMDACAS